MLPHPENGHKYGTPFNTLDEEKMLYIINMRKALCKESICLPDGSLNLKYFNVKKGHYWSKNENNLLMKGIIKHGVCE